MSVTGLVSRIKGKIKAHVLYLGSGGIVDSVTGATVFGGAPKDTITAHAGGGRSSASALQYGWNRVSVCATNADSVVLPAAVAGASVLVIQDGAANAQVFGAGSDTVDGVAGATGVVLSAAKRAWFYCTTAGAWQSLTGVKAT